MPLSVRPSRLYFNKLLLIMGTKSSCNHHNVHPADRGKNPVDLERGGASVERERQHQLHYGKGLGGYHHRSPVSLFRFLFSFPPSPQLTCSRTGLPPAQRCLAWTITLPFTSKRWATGNNSRSATCLVCVGGNLKGKHGSI